MLPPPSPPPSYQVTSVKKLTELLDLDEVSGPDVTEPSLSDLTLPLLSIVLECTTCQANDRQYRDEPPAWSSQVVVGLVMHSLDRSPAFRALMQQRRAIEILSAATLACSNAVDEFGSHIYARGPFADGDGDLSQAVHEGYIPGGTDPPAADGTLSSVDAFGVVHRLDRLRVVEEEDDFPCQSREVRFVPSLTLP